MHANNKIIHGEIQPRQVSWSTTRLCLTDIWENGEEGDTPQAVAFTKAIGRILMVHISIVHSYM